ncbi:hypothetical protein ACOZ7A_000181 [Yersinia enterocolitica]
MISQLQLSAAARQLVYSPRNALVKVSEHTSVYRGFSITRLKHNKINPITRYQVSQGDQSYGKFDAQAQATAYVDQLHQMRNAS